MGKDKRGSGACQYGSSVGYQCGVVDHKEMNYPKFKQRSKSVITQPSRSTTVLSAVPSLGHDLQVPAFLDTCRRKEQD